MPFLITCSAVGDIVALVQLAIKIVEFIGECKDAPQDCLALCQELRSLERLLAVAKSTIAAIRSEEHREIVTERICVVGRHVAEGLDLVAEFNTAFTASDSHNGWKSRLISWSNKTQQLVMWKLKRKANAEAFRVTIARCFEPLIFALLLSVDRGL
ncbi:hypothetical protein BKA62DRAFT_697928 [Auriculariales sp. MPI-PUGE-AT-0066]|nr:hypothetical protein BKA62DRAFT_697928 [Auriculariales sp. MPI-PUGE-AT-0066]